jgi:hypothetical protein
MERIASPPRKDKKSVYLHGSLVAGHSPENDLLSALNFLPPDALLLTGRIENQRNQFAVHKWNIICQKGVR